MRLATLGDRVRPERTRRRAILASVPQRRRRTWPVCRSSVRAQAAQAAIELGKPGLHAITLARSSVEPFLTFSARRDLREEAFKAWARRGENGGKTDNRKIVVEIVRLRAEMARLLGYESYAAYSLEDTMAKTPEAVRGLMDKVWPAGLKRAAEERAALEARARDEGGNFSIEAWDWRYYSEKERKARFDLDEAEVRSYLVLDNVLEAAFDTASKLFGIVFEERDDVPVYHPDVRAWEVRTKKGEHVGLFLGDYFARPSKRSGAWMSSFRTQQKLTGDVRPIVTNVMSVARGAEGTPTLLSFDDARTLFHELGHGLHGLLSDVTYPSLAMTNVLRDFVELPSQLYEHWLSRPEVLKKFALHFESGKPMPDRLLDSSSRRRARSTRASRRSNTRRRRCSTWSCTRWAKPKALDIDTFEKNVLSRIGMPTEIVPRHRVPHFQHIIGGYAAGYYSYLWSEVMDADAFAAFEEAGDIFDRKTATKLKTHIYSAGGKRDALDAYVAFRGRAPEDRRPPAQTRSWCEFLRSPHEGQGAGNGERLWDYRAKPRGADDGAGVGFLDEHDEILALGAHDRCHGEADGGRAAVPQAHGRQLMDDVGVSQRLAVVLAAAHRHLDRLLHHRKPDGGVLDRGAVGRAAGLDDDAVAVVPESNGYAERLLHRRIQVDGVMDFFSARSEHLGRSVDHDLRRVDRTDAEVLGVRALPLGVSGRRERVLPTDVVPVIHRQRQRDDVLPVGVGLEQRIGRRAVRGSPGW